MTSRGRDDDRTSPATADAARSNARALQILGLMALACYAAHASFHLAHDRWWDLLWACHIAAILVGLGLLTKNATLNAVGALLGLMGLPLWLADLAAGGELFPTSLLTHVVALAIGIFGVAQLGMPRGAWWKTAIALVGLIALCRLLTPPDANVNVAFRVQPGWEGVFASHAGYLASTIAGAAAFFFVVEQFTRRVLRWTNNGKRPDALQSSLRDVK